MKNKGWDALEPFKLADKVLQADREVALAAVKEGGWALKYADKALKSDREVVLTAVQSEGGALQFADKSLKADHRILDQIGEWCPSPPPRAPPAEQEWPKGCQIPLSYHPVPDIA